MIEIEDSRSQSNLPVLLPKNESSIQVLRLQIMTVLQRLEVSH